MNPERSRIVGVILLLALIVCASVDAGAGGHVKLAVRETGMYRLTGHDLAAAGLDLPQIDTRTLTLTTQGEPVACRVVGADGGRFTETSAIIFFGEALDTKYTGTNVYWLAWGGSPGPRILPDTPASEAGNRINSFRTVLHIEENHEYGYLIWVPEKGELDPWFWRKITPASPARIPASLPHLADQGDDVLVRVAVRGRTSRPHIDPDHHVVVELNGHSLGEARFDAQSSAIIEAAVPAADLSHGRNEIVVTCPGDTEVGDAEQVYLDWLELEYDRGLVADGAQTRFRHGAAGQANITGLEGESADAYRIVSRAEVHCASDLPVTDGAVSFAVSPDPSATYVVVTDQGYLPVAQVTRPPAPSLRSAGNRADLVVITHDEFRDAVNPLVSHRTRQGLHVAVVPISRIYDEFSYGIFNPVAIREFLRHACANWARPAPRYVLLVGDASYDYRDYLGTGERNYVPAYPVRVRSSIETPTDAFYVCLEGDDHIPEMVIGRLPARSAEHARALCEKIVAYETSAPGGDWRKRALIVADHELSAKDATWYERSSEADALKCEAFGLQALRAYLRHTGISSERPADENRNLVREQATPAILAGLADGCALFLFQGHGAANYLSRQRAVQTDDVASLDNKGRSPLGVLVTCFAGAFDDPQASGSQCMAEHLMNAPGGLIACIGPTRLGGENIEAPLLHRLLSAPNTPLGEAFAAAKQDLIGNTQAEWTLVENYNLLGDPLLTLQLDVRPPAPTATAERLPPLDLRADHNGNRIADVLEKHAADGVYRRYGAPDRQLIAIFCRMATTPSAQDVALIERLGGRVMDIVGPPWGIEVVLPTTGVAPLVQAMPDRLLMVHESTRYGQRVETVQAPERDLGTQHP